ncbi:putative alpha-ketoglutarate-dependent dioxygenase [Cucumis melo var. makuwa]|uniref:Alpha-ketoglutarate-dependent dioxygenase n=2 Tax=Cucumis melo TaxID=3656 RepID=A0A5A7SN55_CUCMM|nr:RNA demethylase ALKBH9B [Cucumis melo]KAA0025681.1 putative alpha-ketoglutarate-dependent dioxygenase [Cucumis melo var. makuwa]TYK12556.1 putative alpha-ketoglutarate-dependent dioxygenase [Cucumis melo var. makuwa]
MAISHQHLKLEDPFLHNYKPSELKIASEFLTTWLPFLSKDLCGGCTKLLSDRIRTLDPADRSDENSGSAPPVEDMHESNGNQDDAFDANSLGSWKDEAETNSLGSWKDGMNGGNEADGGPENSSSDLPSKLNSTKTSGPRMSWADMTQEDELEEEEDEYESEKRLVSLNESTRKLTISKVIERPKLSREQREHIRFMNVGRKKDFICLERFKGKLVNILEGLELHTCIFSAAEQTRIVDHVYALQEMGKRGELRERTFSAPKKWMKGKGRVTMQFGCCYNYAPDKNGNPPGILRSEIVDPIPSLFKVIIRRLVRWHVLPPTCVPDSCIVNIYDEGDCIPPHIDNHDFVRPFCTVSFLSECNIVFGTNLSIVGPGEFSGPIAIPLPVGSVLVLNGNGADVAKHCVPAVPTKRISITFRRIDESKRPIEYSSEPDLQGIQPLPYEARVNDVPPSPVSSEREIRRQPFRGGGHMRTRGSGNRGDPRYDPQNPGRGARHSSADKKSRVN